MTQRNDALTNEEVVEVIHSATTVFLDGFTSGYTSALMTATEGRLPTHIARQMADQAVASCVDSDEVLDQIRDHVTSRLLGAEVDEDQTRVTIIEPPASAR